MAFIEEIHPGTIIASIDDTIAATDDGQVSYAFAAGKAAFFGQHKAFTERYGIVPDWEVNDTMIDSADFLHFLFLSGLSID